MTTTTDTTPMQAAAIIAREYFTIGTRDDGTRYDHLTDDAPQWLRDAVRYAHGDELPNDWRYGIACSAVEAIACGDLRDYDGLYAFADSATDPYTANLVRWLAEDTERVSYVDEALEEQFPPYSGNTFTFHQLLAHAQYIAIYTTATAMLDAFRAQIGE